MFDLSWGELLVVGIVALIVVGPKDLPVMFRTVGRFVGKVQAMAHDFRRTLEAAADDVGVKDIKNEMTGLSKGDPLGLNAAGDRIRELNQKADLSGDLKKSAKNFAKETTGMKDKRPNVEVKKTPPIETESEKKPTATNTEETSES